MERRSRCSSWLRVLATVAVLFAISFRLSVGVESAPVSTATGAPVAFVVSQHKPEAKPAVLTAGFVPLGGHHSAAALGLGDCLWLGASASRLMQVRAAENDSLEPPPYGPLPRASSECRGPPISRVAA